MWQAWPTRCGGLDAKKGLPRSILYGETADDSLGWDCRSGLRTQDRYVACVQLSHNPNTQVLEGRPSRSLGHGRPSASTPLRVSRAPSAGTSTVHIPYGRPGIALGWVWTRNGSPSSYQVSTI